MQTPLLCRKQCVYLICSFAFLLRIIIIFMSVPVSFKCKYTRQYIVSQLRVSNQTLLASGPGPPLETHIKVATYVKKDHLLECIFTFIHSLIVITFVQYKKIIIKQVFSTVCFLAVFFLILPQIFQKLSLTKTRHHNLTKDNNNNKYK